jgi:hypothetical protein
VSFIDSNISEVPLRILTDDGSNAPPNMVIDSLVTNNVEAVVKHRMARSCYTVGSRYQGWSWSQVSPFTQVTLFPTGQLTQAPITIDHGHRKLLQQCKILECHGSGGQFWRFGCPGDCRNAVHRQRPNCWSSTDRVERLREHSGIRQVQPLTRHLFALATD